MLDFMLDFVLDFMLNFMLNFMLCWVILKAGIFLIIKIIVIVAVT